MKSPLIAIISILITCSCNNNNTDKTGSNKKEIADSNRTVMYKLADQQDFKKTINEKQVQLFYLKNGGLQMTVTNYGGRIVNLLVPDKNNQLRDIIVGPETLAQFIDSKEPYFGAAIGRYGNRIAKGTFSINGKSYVLPANNGPNTLHGGIKGFHHVMWDAAMEGDSSIIMKYLSKDGEEGFPGNLNVTISYTLTYDAAVRFTYEATTDKTTVCNLTNHAFYNLNGNDNGTINNHVLQIFADLYTPVDSTLIPTGNHAPVINTPFDFLTPAAIGKRVNDSADQQLKYGAGYDHNFVLNRKTATGMEPAAIITGDLSGITMSIYTREPGLQFYGGNFMKGTNTIKGAKKDEYRTAFALETQHFPDSPNQPAYPSTILKPGEVYKTSSVYKFTR